MDMGCPSAACLGSSRRLLKTNYRHQDLAQRALYADTSSVGPLRCAMPSANFLFSESCMHRPLVSVCLPNRNMRRYLPVRVNTIFHQTYSEWELIVSDNFSEDGAWEFLQNLAAKEKRVSAIQERLGMYDGWNQCIRRARGKYVYVATSDDTMAPDCLEKMVAALEEHPECDIAHCNLKVIDDSGDEFDHGWSSISLFALSSGPLIDVSHLRMAPFDALLLLSGRPVYSPIPTSFILP